MRTLKWLLPVSVVAVLLHTGNLFAQSDTLVDVFPLHIDNEWAYWFSQQAYAAENNTRETWSGSANLKILGSSVATDSTLWLFRQTRNIYYSRTGPGFQENHTIVDTLLFNLIEESSGQHRLYRESAARDDVLPFIRATLASDTTKVWRYRAVGFDNTTTFQIGGIPGFMGYRIYTFGWNVGMFSDSYEWSTSGFYGGNGQHSILTIHIAGVTLPKPGLAPETFSLSPPYPNPFNSSTVITYRLGRREHVQLGIFDLLGRETMMLIDEQKDAGNYRYTLNASVLASGVYFFRLRAGGRSQMQKLVLLK